MTSETPSPVTPTNPATPATSESVVAAAALQLPDATQVALQINSQIATELAARAAQVQAAVQLLDGGATVPFIARYRKEVTGGLDDIQLRTLQERLTYLRELADRKNAVLEAIHGQGKLTETLHAAVLRAETKQVLEDLYLPYKVKRRSKGLIAKEAGLEPLARALFADPTLQPQTEAEKYVGAKAEGGDFATVAAVLDGARDILSEDWAQDAPLLTKLRDWLWTDAIVVSSKVDAKNESDPDVAKFRDYFEYDEPIHRIPSHRALALFRGRTLQILDVSLTLPATLPEERTAHLHDMAQGRIAAHLNWSHSGRAADDWIKKCVLWTWRVKLQMSIERELFTRLREAAEAVAIKVFADNLRDLLLAAPAGAKTVLGLDPGIRTGVKVALIDKTGHLLETATVYPHEPRRDWDGSLQILHKLCQKHGVDLIAIGNGTASQETDKLAADLIKLIKQSQPDLNVQKVVVSEAGASVYSASEFASQEMPDVDVSLRGAASIARRLQDPLAELVKIDPKSIGVGQYQHDVNQVDLSKSLDATVEDCVNAVGVDLNTASAPLLSRVSGLSSSMARQIVQHRMVHGAFANRQALLKVTGLGPKTFEQAAGFLRIRGGDNPLDMTGVHPETYPVVQRILDKLGKPVQEVMGKPELLANIQSQDVADDKFGTVTVQDIVQELAKPGRDPRPDFKVARFNEGVSDISDLKVGMVLHGTVSNVAAFGAFVDLGVHQDGLVHVSQLSYKFIEDAREVVKTGDTVKVIVTDLDVPRKRISLSMKLDAKPTAQGAGKATGQGAGQGGRSHYSTPSNPRNPNNGGRSGGFGGHQNAKPEAGSAMAAAFAKLRK